MDWDLVYKHNKGIQIIFFIEDNWIINSYNFVLDEIFDFEQWQPPVLIDVLINLGCLQCIFLNVSFANETLSRENLLIMFKAFVNAEWWVGFREPSLGALA